MRCVNLEPIIQSKVSDRKTNYPILMHMYVIQKDSTNKPIFQGSSGDTDIENRLMDMGGGRYKGEGGTNGESSMETCTLTYMFPYKWELDV